MSIDTAGNFRGAVLLLGQRIQRCVPLPRAWVRVLDRGHPEIVWSLVPFRRLDHQHENAIASPSPLEIGTESLFTLLDSTSFKNYVSLSGRGLNHVQGEMRSFLPTDCRMKVPDIA